MNDKQLNDILKSARVPERPPEYWEDFPAQVTRQLRRSADSPVHAPHRRFSFLLRPTFTFGGIALLCLIVGFWLGQSRNAHKPPGEATLAEAQKYYREIEQLFPNQVRAIVFDRSGTHLVLADRADVPASSPVFMKICGPKGCQGIVTFSGQQIKIGGKPVDVLVGPRGEVFLAGPDSFWSNQQAGNQIGAYRVEAEPLKSSL